MKFTIIQAVTLSAASDVALLPIRRRQVQHATARSTGILTHQNDGRTFGDGVRVSFPIAVSLSTFFASVISFPSSGRRCQWPRPCLLRSWISGDATLRYVDVGPD